MMNMMIRSRSSLTELIHSSLSRYYTSSASTTAGNVITCLAAVARGPNQPLVIEEIEVDPPQRMEVRLKILYTSICHTDVSAWKSENEGQRAFPRILGHEAVGVVESVGDGVKDMREGDHVIPIFSGECGDCVNCRKTASPTNLCRNFRVDPTRSVMRNDSKCRFRSRIDGGQIFHFLNTSTFSQYTVLDSACVVNLKSPPSAAAVYDAGDPPSLPVPLSDHHLKMMSLFSCCVSTGVGAAWNVADVKAGSTVAVFGLGPLGLAASQGARVRGASKIIGVDINPDKFIKGKAMGITDFINPMESSKPVHERIREMAGGLGVDYSLECVGNCQLLREAFLSTHDGWGRTVLVGIYPTPQLLPLHPMELFDGRSITGTIFGGVKGKSQLHHLAHRCLQHVFLNLPSSSIILKQPPLLCSNHRCNFVCGQDMNLEELITHELPFENINEAFQLLLSGKSLRCLLHL
ncbi:Alcohol dehydrogenase-like 3 [Linum perenne]